MKRLLAVLMGAAIVCAVAYLVSLNEAHVDFHYAPARHFAQVHIVTLLVFAFIAGVLLVLLAVVLQAGRRSVATWGQTRRDRRSDRLDQWEEHGHQLVWQGEHQRGRTLLHRAWRRRPTSPQAVIALAESYRDTGETQRALQLLLGAMTQHHTNPDLLFALADTHRAAGDRVAELTTLERLLALHPRAVRVLRTLRDAYVDVGRWQDAVRLQEIVVAEVRDVQGAPLERQQLTWLRYQAAVAMPDVEARIRSLEALADGRAVPVPVSTSLGDALLAAGRGDEASMLWERALRTTPRTVLVERLAGMATEPRHRDRLRTLLGKLRPDQVHADHVRLLQAQLYLADGNATDAARILNGLQSSLDHPLLHRLWAEVHRRRGELDQAVAAYAQVSDAPCAYRCTRCERIVRGWTAHCPQCKSWDSYRSTVEIELPRSS